MSNLNLYQQLAKQALTQYPINDYALTFLRHNENLVYRVEDRQHEQVYLLRLHLPRHAGFRGLQQTALAIEAELQWLQALHNDTALTVQTPLPARNQALVTQVSAHELPEPVACSMLSWIDGQVSDAEFQQSAEYAYQLGALNATLHAHSRVWQPPAGFLRLRYDQTMLAESVSMMEVAIQHGVVTADDAAQMRAACDHAGELLARIDEASNEWGLIHADLIAGNLLCYADQLAPIDFSLCGFGPLNLDLAITLSGLKPAQRHACLAGYQQPIGAEQRHSIESFFIMMLVVASMRHITNPDWQSWFQRRFPLIAQTYCPKLLHDETFLYDI